MPIERTNGKSQDNILSGSVCISESGAKEELDFWRAVFSSYREGKYDDIKDFIDPNRPLQEQVKRMIRTGLLRDKRIRILDVGCGPLTTLGKVWEDYEVEIVAVDPLAESYKQILAEAGIRPPVPLVEGVGENLLALFPEDSFDYVHCENALDHCYDLASVISNMLNVARPNTVVHIRVFRDEAEYSRYSGFHQWNFGVYCDRVVVWNHKEIHFLDEFVGLRPYEFTLHTELIRYTQTTREILEFDILNLHLPESQWRRLTDGVRVFLDPSEKWLLFDVAEDADISSNFFLHVYPKNNDLLKESGKPCHEISFRWTSGERSRIIRLPGFALEKLLTGQFRQATSHGRTIYSNVWEQWVWPKDGAGQCTLNYKKNDQ